MIYCDLTLQRESMFALSIALRVTNFPSKDCNITVMDYTCFKDDYCLQASKFRWVHID